MALTQCPECTEAVSTLAKFCPHCGYPGPFSQIALTPPVGPGVPNVPSTTWTTPRNRGAAKVVFQVSMGALGLFIVLMIAGANVPLRPAQSPPQPGSTLSPTLSSQAAAPPGPRLPGPTGEMRFLVPYRTIMKDNFRLLPCCDVADALVFWYSVMGDREQLFKAGYASGAPIVEEGSTVAVTAFYKMDFNGSVGEFRVSADDANTRAGLLNAVALITTAGGALGYVPALYVFPP